MLFDVRAVQWLFHAHGPLISAWRCTWTRSSSRAVRRRVVVSYIVIHRHNKSRRRHDRSNRARVRTLATSTHHPSSRSLPPKSLHMRRMFENSSRSFPKKPRRFERFERLGRVGATPREIVRRFPRLRHLTEPAASSRSSLGGLFRSSDGTSGAGCGEDASGDGDAARRREGRGDDAHSAALSSSLPRRSTTSGRAASRGWASSRAIDIRDSARWVSAKSPNSSYTFRIWRDKRMRSSYSTKTVV